MDPLDFTNDSLLGFDFDPNSSLQRYNFVPSQSWPIPMDNNMPHNQNDPSNQRRANTTTGASSNLPATTTAPLQAGNALGYSQALDTSAALMANWGQFQLPQQSQQFNMHDASFDPNNFNTNYTGQLQTSPTDYMATSQAGVNTTTMPMDASFIAAYSTSMEPALSAMSTGTVAFSMNDFRNEFNDMMMNGLPPNMSTGSPNDNWLEVGSLSSSDNDWTNIQTHRQSFDSFPDQAVFNPGQTLHHIRTDSDPHSSQHSDVPLSAHSFGSYEEIAHFPLHSPQSEASLELHPASIQHGFIEEAHDHKIHHCSPAHSHAHSVSVSPPLAAAQPYHIKQSASSSSSPSSTGVGSPQSRRRKTPPTPGASKTITKVTKPAAAKEKRNGTEKRVGRRKGPLSSEQRQQAHEIRKLRACLRCKFLKKTCDKGDPCGGCQPSHARLWQVPCTRIDIKDIAYFMKDWKADFERHVSLGSSVSNIKGFSSEERTLYITHGYNVFLPITAREVYVRDDKCFGMDWVETIHENPKPYEMTTAKLSAGMEGVSRALLSEYLDRHIDGGFEKFVDDYFEGTKFLTELLKTAYRYYLREKLPVIRKALKLVLAYNLTLHITMVEGLSEEEAQIGKIEDETSKFAGKTVAPVMINFQVKVALADMWRELQKDILEELSALYSSVYSGEKLKNWPTIFMLAAILLAIWEEMQFDCHYRVPDTGAAQKFCKDMESTPVGVIVGLFSAISQKLPAFTEWDTNLHHNLLNSNPAVCEAMTEVRQHVTKYESYLKGRSEAKFDRNDFDCLSNKFLAKLVIRAN
ncbi:hypothetical protein M501DRAFT_354962 [Patellaria atrata CBS 101060]|uniref:Zn(2)-C6 fungal-type domain-containing protein n=1 Tax=Patellaria atrata CBS 101060 TaxID=1346257 RepID=A0A9P4VUC8_9PEZI|nr:hypothetical protein M501DRAFT_354962 [Patellaria atrata CBS 101060]